MWKREKVQIVFAQLIRELTFSQPENDIWLQEMNKKRKESKKCEKIKKSQRSQKIKVRNKIQINNEKEYTASSPSPAHAWWPSRCTTPPTGPKWAVCWCPDTEHPLTRQSQPSQATHNSRPSGRVCRHPRLSPHFATKHARWETEATPDTPPPTTATPCTHLATATCIGVSSYLLHSTCMIVRQSFRLSCWRSRSVLWSRWPLIPYKPVKTRKCGKKWRKRQNLFGRKRKLQRKQCANILAQNYPVSEVHTTHSSDRQKVPPSSDAWVSKRRTTRYTTNMPLLATALCVTCTHPSGQWLSISATWLWEASEDWKDTWSMPLFLSPLSNVCFFPF